MDGLRAMREARYEQAAARTTGPAAAPKKAKGAAVRPPEAAARPSTDPEPDGEALCGHRAISGRTCTREHGHAAKSHRYS